MQNKNLIAIMRGAAIAGNILFVLWMTFNALKEGFSGTIYEKISYVGLICLLALNSYLVLGCSRHQLKPKNPNFQKYKTKWDI